MPRCGSYLHRLFAKVVIILSISLKNIDLIDSFVVTPLKLLQLKILCTKSVKKTNLLFFPNQNISTKLWNQNNIQSEVTTKPLATIVGYISQKDEYDLGQILNGVGFEYVSSASLEGNLIPFTYKYVKASGMLKLVENEISKDQKAPKWIPTQSGEERLNYSPYHIVSYDRKKNVLVANGWSFLDPDESEPMSAFDIDAANEEGQYRPKWGDDKEGNNNPNYHHHDEFILSTLGFDIKPMTKEEVLSDAERFIERPVAKSVLLDGATDTPNEKVTNNNFNFSGSVRDDDIEKGIFVCAIGGLPLFTTDDLSPTTASSGWLSFARPVSADHIRLVHPETNSMDQRIEVVCNRSGCHLGHYFGKGEGYCINASALNFIPSDRCIPQSQWNKKTNPISWHALSSSEEIGIAARGIDTLRDAITKNISTKVIFLGAGCFWHVEFALRRLPGIIDTSVGYCGGQTNSPSYKEVCTGNTNHAEVVKCHFDPSVLQPSNLLDCFLAMHDPTNVRSHGKRAAGSGQYRSCIFVQDEELELISRDVVSECTKQLAKLLSTEVRRLPEDSFWVAESRHQRHDERVKKYDNEQNRTIPLLKWVSEYGRRSSSIWGSSETIQVDSDLDDGIARMMI